MKYINFFLVCGISVLISAGQIMSADSISVNRIDGLDPGNGLMAQTPIRFYLHYQVGEFTVTGVLNGFHVMSADGALWEPITAEPVAPLTMVMIFDLIVRFYEFSVDGQGADTIDFYGYSISPPHLSAGYDNDLFYIATEVTEDQIGKHLCLDTAPPAISDWVWSPGGADDLSGLGRAVLLRDS